MKKKDIFGDEIVDTKAQQEDFQALFLQSTNSLGTKRKPGDVFEAEILSISGDTAFVATGTPVDGVLPVAELRDKKGELLFKKGDRIQVRVIRVTESELRLKREGTTGSSEEVESLEDAFDMELPVKGKVTEVIKGGFRVVVAGVKGFCPLSQMDFRVVEQNEYVNRQFDFLITKFSERGRDLVLSRRKLLELQQAESEGAFLQKAKVGDEFDAEITRLEKYGAFARIKDEGIEGLIPISELAWGRINHPSDVVQLGAQVRVQLQKIEADDSRLRLSLSLKAAGGAGLDPLLSGAVQLGQVFQGVVEKRENFGLFVQLKPGLSGLLPRSQWRDSVDAQGFEHKKKGDPITVRVAEIDLERRRLSLALPLEEGFDASGYIGAQAGQKLGSLGDAFKNLTKPRGK